MDIIGTGKALRTWGEGHLLAFSGIDGITDFENGLCFRTSFGKTGIELMLPGTAEILFSEKLPDKTFLTGDVIILDIDGNLLRGAFLDSMHFLVEGRCRILRGSDETVIYERGGRTLIGVKNFFDASNINADIDETINARMQWLSSLNIPRHVPQEKLKYMFKALSIMKTQLYTPAGWIKHRWTTPDRWPHRRMWLWDSAFHAVGWRHIDTEIARDSIEAVLDCQCEDGKIPCTCGPDIRSEETQPPVLGMAVMAIDEIAPDSDWLNKVYKGLCRYIEWDIANRSSGGRGLYGWKINKQYPVSRCGESGMDNSSRFDGDCPLETVDLNSYIAMECETLGKIALRLGKEKDSCRWDAMHKRICGLVNEHLWDETQGLYFDCNAETGERTGVMSGAGFLPLICGAPSGNRARRLASHLGKGGRFSTALPVPSISPAKKEFYFRDMWRGPVWVNLNYLIARGFSRYGMESVSRMIKDRTMREIERFYDAYGTFFEFYDAEGLTAPPDLFRKGKSEQGSEYHQSLNDYGWTATIYLDWLAAG